MISAKSNEKVKALRALAQKKCRRERGEYLVEGVKMVREAILSGQTISLIERGDYSPSVTLALTIAKVCGVTVEEVFYLQEETENEK